MITERRDMTPLLGKDWMKRLKVKIGRMQLTENNQSESEKVFRKLPDLFDNNETMKDTEINIQFKPGHYQVKPKRRRCRTRTRKIDKIRTSREDKRRGRRLFRITGGHILENDESNIALDSRNLNDSCIKNRPHVPDMAELF